MVRKIAIAFSFVSLLVRAPAFAGKAPACTSKVTLTAAPLPVIAGAVESIDFTVKNPTRTARTAVEWTFSDNGVVVAQGTVDIAGNVSVTVKTPWTATAGPHTLKLQIDPANKLAEAGTCLNDNSKTLTLNV